MKSIKAKVLLSITLTLLLAYFIIMIISNASSVKAFSETISTYDGRWNMNYGETIHLKSLLMNKASCIFSIITASVNLLICIYLFIATLWNKAFSKVAVFVSVLVLISMGMFKMCVHSMFGVMFGFTTEALNIIVAFFPVLLIIFIDITVAVIFINLNKKEEIKSGE